MRAMLKTILVLTKDSQWCSRLLHSRRLKDYIWVFEGRVDDPINMGKESPDLVLVDVNLLPPPESADLTRIHHLLEGYHCIAVHTPGRQPELVDVRKAFIAGAQDLVEKPSNGSEVARLLKSSSVELRTATK